ncbi:tripartite motif-containing protein 16-like [Mustelus asterias]
MAPDCRLAPAAQSEVPEHLNKLTPATRELSEQLEKQLEAFTQRHLPVSATTGQQHTESQSPESQSPLQNAPVAQSSPPSASFQDAERLTVTRPRNAQECHREPQTRQELIQYLTKVTFDLNTASPMVQLSDDRRCAVNSHPKVQKYPRHEARFLHLDQVLAEQEFSDGRHYWEISVTGSPIRIGISYRHIVRNSRGVASLLGGNQVSWCLELAEGKRTVWHCNKSGELLPCPYQRLGIYLNIPGQTLIFYGISKGTAEPLQHVPASFTLPLLPAFQISRGARIWIED